MIARVPGHNKSLIQISCERQKKPAEGTRAGLVFGCLQVGKSLSPFKESERIMPFLKAEVCCRYQERERPPTGPASALTTKASARRAQAKYFIILVQTEATSMPVSRRDLLSADNQVLAAYESRELLFPPRASCKRISTRWNEIIRSRR